MNSQSKYHASRKQNRFPIFITVKLILLLILLFPCPLPGQNLVPNPSFEGNSQLDENPSTITDQFKYVNDWKLLGWQSFYCHCKTHDPLNWNFSACRKHLYQPRTGCAMIKMVYEESTRTDTDLHAEPEYKGSASYLECKLTEPLELGAVYEMSFWVFFPKDTIVEQSILTHIGFLPTLHYISMRPQSLLYMNRFFADSIPMGEWFQVKKYIRALCPLEYVVIGAFRNSTFPLVNRFIWTPYPFYFIDDVKVEKINADTLDKNIIPTPFCKFFEEEEERLEVPTEKAITLYFESDSSLLSREQQVRLDSFIAAVDSRWKPVYSIVGHTDNTGHENEKLSFQRAVNTKQLLKTNHQIPEFRFVCFSEGSKNPASSNESETGRSKNRRVELSVTSLNKQSGLYRYCIELVHNNEYVKAREYLKKWIYTANDYEVIYILFDNRFDLLRKTKEWKHISDEIKKKYAKAYPSKHAFFLDSLRCEDQRYRTLELPILGLSGFFKEYETFRFEDYSCDDDTRDSLDQINLDVLISFLKQNSFPKISEIGRRNAQGLVYILIHSGDTILMDQYLPIIERHCLEGEAEWITYAMMFDRNLIIKGLHQQFGTQSVLNDMKTEMSLAPMDNLEIVNQRRVNIGLLPISYEQVLARQKVMGR